MFQIMPAPVTGWSVVHNGRRVTQDGHFSKQASITLVDSFVEKEQAQQLCDKLNREVRIFGL